MTKQFSAIASALGYFYQARYALLLLLSADHENEISIERLDDIAFERNGTATELLQAKHHIKQTGSLTDSSLDLWKTLRVWSSKVAADELDPGRVILTIITTGKAPEGSAASKLRPADSRERDPLAASSILRKVTQTSKSQDKTMQDCFRTFMALPEKLQQALLESVQVLDSSPNITDTRDQILQRLRISSRPEHLELVYERVEGWWFNKVVDHLSSGAVTPISYNELRTKVNDIREEYSRDNLPIEFLEEIMPDEDSLTKEQRIFVHQLRLISVGEPRILYAINDFYRAFYQRSKWAREDLLGVGELDKYENRLVEEWNRWHEIMKEDLADEPTDEQMQKAGRDLFNMFDTKMELHIRERCTEPYVMRGSYHMLANKRKVGWHAKFVDRLSALLAESH